MSLKSYWREDGVSPIIPEDALIEILSSLKTGVVFLSTVPSSDAEMRIVQALAGLNHAKILYCRELIEQLVEIIKNPHNGSPTDEVCARLMGCPVIIRFADRIYGLTATMECLAKICTKLSKDNVIIVTGDYLDKYVPELLQQLDAKQYYICY